MAELSKLKSKKIAVYSEKGGVGKTTVLVSLAHKMAVTSDSVFLDADASSQSLHDVLKFYELDPKMVYREKICVLPFLLEIHKTIEFFFIDLAGREADSIELEYFKYLDLIIIPIPPIYSNYSTPIHTVEKLLKNGIDPKNILITLNCMWSDTHLDQQIKQEFIECLNILASKYNLNYFFQGISFSSSLNKNSNCLKVNSKYVQDIDLLSKLVDTIIAK